MNWNNVDLNTREIECNLIDPLSFEELLLQIAFNIKVINKVTITAEFNAALQSRVMTAKEVFLANLENIQRKALEDRNENE